ncbi:MAG TPA: phospholipase D-like domain-containing protein [Candidatus Dormibacteraeota bacterium]
MRAAAKQNGVSVKAYAGTTGVLLGCDVDARRRDGLLGFAIERSGGSGGHRWLPNLLNFPGVAHKPGAPVSSEEAPIQKFRWSDYTIFPGTDYEYAIHPVYGEPGKPKVGEGPAVRVTSSSTDKGDHRVIFNRAAAASQAFSREFPGLGEKMDAVEGKHEEVHLPPEALAWLSRGALEQITGFCDQAKDPTWALDVAIYEFELPAIIESLEAARARGAQVRIVYHAKPNDPQTAENERNLRKWPKAIKRARLTSAICHDKFIVLSRIDREERVPQAVLCGSTNFTENGVYRQANVVHVAAVSDVAARYLSAFEALFGGASQSDMRKWINANDPLSADGPLQVGFSPRTDEVDLDFFVGEINKARRDLLFCTAFAIKDRVLEALLGKPHDDVLRLGVQNSRSKITGFHRDRTADFSAAAFLNKGLEGFLKESTAGQKGNILIHTKLIVIDFTSPAPTVISGSHNFSHNASSNNDENYLVIRGNADVADCYGVELMRIYDHYRFRYHVKAKEPGAKDPCPRPPGTLCPSDLWTTPYFEEGSLEMTDRLRFGGRAG